MPQTQVNKILAVAGRIRLRSRSLHMIDLFAGLEQAGCEVTLLCESLPQEIFPQAPGFQILKWSSFLGRWSALAFSSQFRDFAARLGAQVVHVHGHLKGITASRFVSSVRLPVVYTPYTMDHLLELVAIQSRSHRVISLSEYMRQALATRGKVPREKLRVVPPGIDVRLYEERLPCQGNRRPVVGCVAPFEPERGQMIFLQAAKLLLDSGCKASFVLAGDGPMEFDLRKEARRLGISHHVIFTTRLPNYRVAIAGLDILVRPAIKGGATYNLMEALAMGKAIVATSSGEIPEMLVEDETGLVVGKKNAPAIAAAVRKLLDNPPLAQEIGRRARQEAATKFSVERLVARTQLVYQEALEAFETEKA